MPEVDSFAKWAIRDARERFPDLTANGFRTPADTGPALSEDDPTTVGDVGTALAFLEQLIPTVSPRVNSYAAKHLAEAWGALVGRSPYVSNGALIAAAAYLGVTVRRCDPGSPNAWLGLGQRSLARIAAWIEREGCRDA